MLRSVVSVVAAFPVFFLAFALLDILFRMGSSGGTWVGEAFFGYLAGVLGMVIALEVCAKISKQSRGANWWAIGLIVVINAGFFANGLMADPSNLRYPTDLLVANSTGVLVGILSAAYGHRSLRT